jgi:uncharacterized SAM-binding protein YcdF (DUF218 family)
MSSPDLLVVLGKNIGVGSTVEDIQRADDHLSLESRISAEAAGMVYEAYPRPDNLNILFSTGHTAGPDVPSEAAAMAAHMKALYPGIPEDRVHTEEKSFDTRTNAIEVASWLDSRPTFRQGRIDLMSVGYHIGNAAILFNRLGVPISRTYASDEVLRERSEKDEVFIQDWFGSSRIQKELKKEGLRSVLLATIDRRGRLLQTVTQRSRG